MLGRVLFLIEWHGLTHVNISASWSSLSVRKRPRLNPEVSLSATRSAGHSRVPKSEGYLNRSFPGVKKGGMKGEVKRGEVMGE